MMMVTLTLQCIVKCVVKHHKLITFIANFCK